MECDFGHYRRSFFTGMATSLSVINVINCIYFAIQAPDQRKLILVTASLFGLVTNIITTYFYLIPGFQSLHLQQYMMVCFLLTLYTISTASAKRYFVYSETKKELQELILVAVIAVALMFAEAVYSKSLFYKSSKSGMLILGIIPLAHIIMGILLFVRQTRKKLSENTIGYSLASWNVFVNVVLASLWLLWIILFLLGISAADIEVFLISVLVTAESSVGIISSQLKHRRSESYPREDTRIIEESLLFFKSPPPSRKNTMK
jgi:hypothetical protein